MKKMRLHILLLLLVCGSALVSCETWLDTSPNSEIRGEDLFKTEDGFRDALAGIYTAMNEAELYGGNMTMLMDIFGGNYTSVGSTFDNFLLFDTGASDVELYFSTIWGNLYNLIANCNYLIDYLEKADRTIFEKSVWEIIYAEALALRAMFHFDLARIWGPVPTDDGMSKQSVPFMDEVTTLSKAPLTLDALLTRVTTDLNKARELIRLHDPIGPEAGEYEKRSFSTSSALPGSGFDNQGFFFYRTYKMNYYAMTALLARVSMYHNKLTAAAGYAREVIDSDRFEFIPYDERATYGLHVQRFESIFRLYKMNIEEKIGERYFEFNSLSANSSYILRAPFDDIFSGGVSLDYRYRYATAIPANRPSRQPTWYNQSANIIPLFNLSEMYLTIAEAERDWEYIQLLRDNRGYTGNNRWTEAQLQNMDFDLTLRQEWHREFLTQGQMFFFHKRLNLQNFLYFNLQSPTEVYNIEYPSLELEFGNVRPKNQ